MIIPVEPSQPPEHNLPQLTVDRAERDGAQVVALTGELDLHSAGELQDALDRASAGENSRVCLDLGALQFIDSTGLAIVIRAHQASVAAGGQLVVVCAPGAVRRTFETTGLMTLLSIVATVDEAFAAFV